MAPSIGGEVGSQVLELYDPFLLLTLPNRSPKSSLVGAELCGWASPARTRPGSIRTACPSTPAPTWCPRAASGPRPCRRTSPTRATWSPSGWTRRAGCSTAWTTPAPCCSSAVSVPPSPSGLWSTSTASPGECSYWVSCPGKWALW